VHNFTSNYLTFAARGNGRIVDRNITTGCLRHVVYLLRDKNWQYNNAKLAAQVGAKQRRVQGTPARTPLYVAACVPARP
jgi:hypothetical protein